MEILFYAVLLYEKLAMNWVMAPASLLSFLSVLCQVSHLVLGQEREQIKIARKKRTTDLTDSLRLLLKDERHLKIYETIT